MSISVVAGPIVLGAANGANLTVPLSGLLVQNDLVIVFGGHGITHDATVGVTDAGYTPLISDAAAAPALFLGRKVMGATPDASFTGIGEGNAEDACVYGYIALRGYDPANIEDVARTLANGNGINPNPPAITPVTDGALILALALSMSNDAAFNVPSGYTGAIFGQNETTDSASMGMAYLAQVSAAPENPGTFNPWNSALWKTVTLAIRPASLAVGQPTMRRWGGVPGMNQYTGRRGW